jgi:hypothetical protein
MSSSLKRMPLYKDLKLRREREKEIKRVKEEVIKFLYIYPNRIGQCYTLKVNLESTPKWLAF